MSIPNVLCLSGHDPSGGAGLQADFEAIAAQGCHAAGVITALTRQDTRNAYSVSPIADAEFAAQIDTLIADMDFAAVKIGLLGSPGQVKIIADFARTHAAMPLVLDPVITAGGGATLAQNPVANALSELLLPQASIITPNAAEARRLCPGTYDLAACGSALAQRVSWVLITGGDEASAQHSEEVVNTLYNVNGPVQTCRWPHLPHHYHGSGCTLASALAANLALGQGMQDAVRSAQAYTWQCLRDAFQPGRGQHIPNRLGHYRT